MRLLRQPHQVLLAGAVSIFFNTPLLTGNTPLLTGNTPLLTGNTTE